MELKERLIKLLLIEDNPAEADLVIEYLSEGETQSFQISHADSLANGLEMLAKEMPDIILLDLFLPDSQGLQTFRTLISNYSSIPIIVLTGLDDDTIGVLTVSEGAQDYLTKNELSAKLLIRTINYSIQRKQNEKKILELNNQLRERTTELEAANKELETFSYAVAHDLKTPLVSIIGFGNLLRDKLADKNDDSLMKHVNRIINAGESMQKLIEDLLTFSSLKNWELKRRAINLSAICIEVLGEFIDLDKERKIETIIPQGVKGDADDGLIRIVLRNLLGNAYKYTKNKQDTIIEFGTQSEGDKTVYFVKDNGIGFDIESSKKLFTPFHRLANSVGFKGTGIGLATVKRIIDRHGGKIWASAEPDKGSVFYFTLE